MPWLETWPMEQRGDFVRECESGVFTMTELAAQSGLVGRPATSGWRGTRWRVCSACRDRSRRPRHSPQATEAKLLAALVAVRKRHPHWGAKKLLTVAARRAPTADWPCPSTVSTHLQAQGLIAPRRRRAVQPRGAERPAGDHGGE